MRNRSGRWAGALAATWLLVCVGCVWAEEAQPPQKCLLWKVGSETATLYLFGSIHTANAEMYPLNPTIEKAFDEVDTLILELALTPETQAKAARLSLLKGTYPEGETLEANLSEAAREKLKAYLEPRGLTPAAVNNMRPWFVQLMLAMQEYLRLGYDPALGLDLYFHAKATEQGKKVVSLESVEEQMEVLAGASAEVQALALVETLENLPRVKDIIGRMVDAWKAGDAEGLHRIVEEERSENPKLKAYEKKLIEDRNVTMAARLEEYLKTEGTYFAVVGAAHLVGPKGIVRLLEEKKYAVEQLDKSPEPAKEEGEPREKPAEPVAAS